MPRKNKLGLYLKLVYVGMAGCLFSIACLLVVFLYDFQRMRELQSLRVSLPLPWKVFLMVSFFLFLVSLFVLAVFSIYYYMDSKKYRMMVEKENAIELLKMKEEIRKEDDGTIGKKERFDFIDGEKMTFKEIRSIYLFLYPKVYGLVSLCSSIVFVVLFSVSFLMKEWRLMLLFLGYLVFPIFLLILVYLIMPSSFAKKTEKDYRRTVSIHGNSLRFKMEMDQEEEEHDVFFSDCIKAKETDGMYLFVFKDSKGHRHCFYLKKREDMDQRLASYLSLEVKRINSQVSLK